MLGGGGGAMCAGTEETCMSSTHAHQGRMCSGVPAPLISDPTPGKPRGGVWAALLHIQATSR